MTRTGYTFAMGVTALILAGAVYGTVLFLSLIWSDGTPTLLAVLATVLLSVFIALLGAALWMFKRERAELG